MTISPESPATPTESDEGTPLSPGAQVGIAVFVLIVLGFSAAMLLSSPAFKPSLATVSIAALDRPAEQPVALAANARVGFGLRLGAYSYAGPDYVVIRVELLRAGAVVAQMRCRAFDFEGSAGGGTAVTSYNSDCQMTVPAGGADRVRAVASQEGAGALTVSDVTLPVYAP
jgi:hypothetical protein